MVVFDTLRLVELLLLLERVFVEKLLELLVAVVDTHLFEGIGLEDLKTKDVENADELAAWTIEHGIDPRDQPAEENLVRRHRKRRARLRRLGHLERDLGCCATHLDCTDRHCLVQFFSCHAP